MLRLFPSAIILAGFLSFARAATPLPSPLTDFTDRHCSACHNDVDREGGLDLTTLTFDPAEPDNFQTWVEVHDRVQSGEMPPKEKKRPDAAEQRAFIAGLGETLISAERKASVSEGRTTRRRLNSTEFENALRDLLHAPWLELKDQLPEDGEAFRFNKVSSALDISYVHMSRYMSAADYALKQVIAVKYNRPPPTTTRYYAREQISLTTFKDFPDRAKFPVLGHESQPDVRWGRAPLTVGPANAEVREQEAIAWVSSNFAAGFTSRWSGFRVPIAGRYRLRFSGYTVWVGPGGSLDLLMAGNPAAKKMPARPGEWFRPHGDKISPGRRSEPVTIYAQGGTKNRRLGAFDLQAEPGVFGVDEVWLNPNEYIVTDSNRLYRSRPTGFRGLFTNPLAQRDGQPGVAFRWMEVEGPLHDADTFAGFGLLFGDLAVRDAAVPGTGVKIQVLQPAPPKPGVQRQFDREGFGTTMLASREVEVISTNPSTDAERLIRGFIPRAYRRPGPESDVQRAIAFFQQQTASGLSFTNAMLATYTALLASPQFLFIDEKTGPLDDFALATRLAFFLWNSAPDVALRRLAERGELRQPGVLARETDRLLKDPKSRRFVHAFLDYWLELRRSDETTPSTTLYNDYYIDDSLLEAALDETRLFFTELLQRDLPARSVVDSDFTFLNNRLARHYGIEGVEGAHMRRVALPADSVRGGVLTQAAILKVTANGTTTSPVLRGKWIMERIAGFDVPPPPAAVPAVEPDIRGAVTIREQLDKHRADESCAGCHRKIDPPGFALESFDVMGAWRDRYRAESISVPPEHGFGKNGWPFTFHYGRAVDPSGKLPDGRSFNDVRDFKRLILEDEEQIARNVVRHLATYATGAPVRFSDRAAVDGILRAAKPGGYGVRSLVHTIIASELFLNK
jgi:hypothetical protein